MTAPRTPHPYTTHDPAVDAQLAQLLGGFGDALDRRLLAEMMTSVYRLGGGGAPPPVPPARPRCGRPACPAARRFRRCARPAALGRDDDLGLPARRGRLLHRRP